MTVLRLVSTPAFIPHPRGNRELVLFIYFYFSLYRGTDTYGCTKKCSIAVASLREPRSQVPQFPGEAQAQNYMLAVPKAACLRIATRAGRKEKKLKDRKKQQEQLGCSGCHTNSKEMHYQFLLSLGLFQRDQQLWKVQGARQHWAPQKTGMK